MTHGFGWGVDAVVHALLWRGIRGRPVLGFLLVLLPLLGSCALDSPGFSEYHPDRFSTTKLVEVPFVPDDSYRCGPASLASLLTHAGVPRSKQQISRVIYSASAKGTIPSDLVWYARKQGLNVESGRGSWKRITRHLDEGRPVLVFLERIGFARNDPHFMVAVGYGNRHLIAHSGTTRYLRMSRLRFLERWESLGRWMMVVINRRLTARLRNPEST